MKWYVFTRCSERQWQNPYFVLCDPVANGLTRITKDFQMGKHYGRCQNELPGFFLYFESGNK